MPFWYKHRALVLGGAGFCGSHLCAELVQRGSQVIATDKWLAPDSFLRLSGTYDKVHFERLDIQDLPSLRLLLERFPVDTVFLLAAQPIVSISNSAPMETALVNILGTYNVLEAVRLLPEPPRLVFASSGAYYGATNVTHAIPEDAPALVAGNIYAPSKAAADLAVRCYSKIYNLRAACCRWMNTYGPGDTNFSRIIPATMRRLARGEQPVIDLTDGTNILELLHVRDMIQAYLEVAEQVDRSDVKGEAFNFGGGDPLTLKYVVQQATHAWNSVTGQFIPEEPIITGPPVNSVKYLDISRAKDRLGWVPRIPLADGLRETAQWYREYLG